MKEHLNRTECCLTIVKAIDDIVTRGKSKNILMLNNYRHTTCDMRRQVVAVMNESVGGCGKVRCLWL